MLALLGGATIVVVSRLRVKTHWEVEVYIHPFLNSALYGVEEVPIARLPPHLPPVVKFRIQPSRRFVLTNVDSDNGTLNKHRQR